MRHERPVGLGVLLPDSSSWHVVPGESLRVGREEDCDIVLVREEASRLALEVFVFSTNVAVRVHQREPGFLVADTVDQIGAVRRRTTVQRGGTLLFAGALGALTLRLGDGPQAVSETVATFRFVEESWLPDNPRPGSTAVVDDDRPREQWARWLVSAEALWVAADRRSIPTEEGVRAHLRDRHPQWPTRTPAEPRRAIAEALYYYGFDASVVPRDRFWSAGLELLLTNGWPRRSLVVWVTRTATETGWAPVGLGGRQGPRLPRT